MISYWTTTTLEVEHQDDGGPGMMVLALVLTLLSSDSG
jgi:hypothetical protein